MRSIDYYMRFDPIGALATYNLDSYPPRIRYKVLDKLSESELEQYFTCLRTFDLLRFSKFNVPNLIQFAGRRLPIPHDAVMITIRNGHVSNLRVMIEELGVEPTTSMMQFAVTHGQVGIVRYLISMGVPITSEAYNLLGLPEGDDQKQDNDDDE